MRLLLIEDETRLARLVAETLDAAGFVVDHFDCIAEARAASRVAPYALIVLDRRLPDGDGLTAIPELRQALPGVPILVLTALDSVAARVEGLNRGADDYLVKPFAMDELLARIRAALRRPGAAPQPPVRCGRLEFDPAPRTLAVDGAPVVLARRELALVEALMLRKGRVVPRATLMDMIYGLDDEVSDNGFDALAHRLRRRIAALGAGAELHTVRGLGLMLRATAG